MGDDTLVLLLALAYLAVMLVIGVWANTRMKSAKEFLVAGQSLGFFVMAMASFSSIQSGWGMVGVTGSVSAWGMGGLAVALLAPLGFALTWFLLGGKLRALSDRYEVYSVPDLLALRYGGKRHVGVAISVALIVGAIGYMTAQVVASGVITALLLDVSFQSGLVIGALVVALYTVAGGMLAAVWTDLLQGIVMIVMSVVVFFIAIGVAGGWGDTLATIAGSDQDYLALDGVQPASWWAAGALMVGLGMVGQPQLVHKFLMLRSPVELRWGALVAAVGYGVTTLFSIGVGLAARAQIINGEMVEPAKLDDTATAFLDRFASPVVVALALTALLAAIMSSASSFITIGASAMTRDLLGALGLRSRNELLQNRIASAAITLIAVLVALFLDQIIFLLGAIGWAAFAGAILGPVVLGLYWRRGTSGAATAAIVGSLSFNIVLALAAKFEWWTPPASFFAPFMVVAVGVLIYVIVSLVGPSSADADSFDRIQAAMSPEAPQQQQKPIPIAAAAGASP